MKQHYSCSSLPRRRIKKHLNFAPVAESKLEFETPAPNQKEGEIKRIQDLTKDFKRQSFQDSELIPVEINTSIGEGHTDKPKVSKEKS